MRSNLQSTSKKDSGHAELFAGRQLKLPDQRDRQDQDQQIRDGTDDRGAESQQRNIEALFLILGNVKVPELGQGHALHAHRQKDTERRGSGEDHGAVHDPPEGPVGREDSKIQDQDGHLDQVRKHAPENDVDGAPLERHRVR